MQKNKILVTCPKGLPPFLKEELISLKFPVISENIAGVETKGTFDDCMLLNLNLRTGHRVLYFISGFKAENPAQLYNMVSKINWGNYIHADGYISVTSTVDNPGIRDSRFANMKCKDAIVDRIKSKTGKRPDSGSERNRAVIHLYWKGEECAVYLDTSGESLSMRGYRKIPLKAPMQETLAAAVVKASGWNGEGNFINPMCGSGTLAIEAALKALNRASGILRNNYGFMHIKDFNRVLWDELRKNGRDSAKRRFNGKIIATDISRNAVEAARKNAATAGVDRLIQFEVSSFEDTTVPEGGGVVLLNPEYGERLGEIKELEKTYKGIGDFFKRRCKGYEGYIFTGNMDLAKKVGLRASGRTVFFNGKIECRLLKYELYEGSKERDRRVKG